MQDEGSARETTFNYDIYQPLLLIQLGVLLSGTLKSSKLSELHQSIMYSPVGYAYQ